MPQNETPPRWEIEQMIRQSIKTEFDDFLKEGGALEKIFIIRLIELTNRVNSMWSIGKWVIGIVGAMFLGTLYQMVVALVNIVGIKK